MKDRLDACLVLGCNGSTTEDGFCCCGGVQNAVLDLGQLELEGYRDVLDFLERAGDLFSGPIYDYNKCANVLSFLYRNHQAYSEKMLHHVQGFLRQHRPCGIWLMLILNEDLKGEQL